VRGGLWIFAAPGRPWLRRPPPLPARGGSGSLVVALDLRTHQAVVEHSGGPVKRVPLTPNRAVADVTSDVLAVVVAVGGAVQINGVPREVPWPVSLDQDNEHAGYDPDRVSEYFAAATRRRSPSRPSGRRSEAGRHRSMRGGGRSTWRTLIAGRRPLGRHPGRIHPQLGRRSRRSQPPRGGAGLRPLRVPPGRKQG
jgi:uncharacterized protein DUF5996